MQRTEFGRRNFLKSSLAGAAGLLLADPYALRAASADSLEIEQPFHGAVLNHRHGRQTSAGLTIQVTGNAATGDRVLINGQPTERTGNGFSAKVQLHEKETDIVATSEGNGERNKHRVRIVWDRYSEPRYRFSVDDNSFFLRDIAQKGYKSLFDCFYLEMLRGLNKKYGTKFVLNIYYTTGADFNLTQFPDRYRSQWADNAEWLKLAFHARADQPNRPYQNAPAEQLIADLDLVNEQIHRFAGDATYSAPTVIHWGMVQPAALKPLAQRGVKVLSGYFSRRGDSWDVNYLLDDIRSEYLSRHDALADFDSGIIFSKVDIVCNNTPVDRVVPTLAPLATDPNQAEVMDLFTHEQYFWPFYRNYLPDHAQRVEAAIRWVTENGYKPVFFHEGFLGREA